MDNTIVKVCQRISTMEPGTRPSFRAKAHGCSSLTEDELLTIILGKKELCSYAHRELAEMTFEQLLHNGVDTVSALKIDALKEYCQRMMMPKELKHLDNTDSVVSYLRPSMQKLQQEQFRVLCLDNSLHLLEDKVLTTGTCDMSLVSVRELLVFVLRTRSSNILVCHNHPGGLPTPSNEDHVVTEQIRNGCKAVGISLIDHVIIGGNGGYFSFRERGYLE